MDGDDTLVMLDPRINGLPASEGSIVGAFIGDQVFPLYKRSLRSYTAPKDNNKYNGLLLTNVFSFNRLDFHLYAYMIHYFGVLGFWGCCHV